MREAGTLPAAYLCARKGVETVNPLSDRPEFLPLAPQVLD